jgi:glycosyltransferase involved in cell wall biosynthesis
VHVLGPTQEPPAALLGEADVVALVSEGESFGMAAAEAAAAGVPVVVSDRCGVRDFFRADEALVVPYEGAAVTEALRRILSDPELRSRLGEGGRAAARRMSWEHVVDRQEEIYRAVVASTAASTRASTDGP